MITVKGTNDIPEVLDATSADGSGPVSTGELLATAVEDAGSIKGTVTFTDADGGDVGNGEVDGSGTLEYSVSDGGTGSFGTLIYDEASGEWTYTIDPALEQSLDAGQVETETFTITASDQDGGSVSQKIVITVKGTNDIPEVAVANTSDGTPLDVDGHIQGSVTEAQTTIGDDGDLVTSDGTPTVHGELTFTDVDTVDVGNASAETAGGLETTLIYQLSSNDHAGSSADSFNPASDSSSDSVLTVSGVYGDLTYDAINGTWTYTLDNDRDATKELTDASLVKESFTVTATDSEGASVEQVIDINVAGKTDLVEYELTFDGQSASWTNALVVAVTDSDGNTILYTDWDNSKGIDVGSTLQFTAAEDSTVEYFLIPRVTEDKLDSLTYEDGAIDYNGKGNDHTEVRVVTDEDTGDKTFSFEDGGGTDYNDFVFTESKSEADLHLEGTEGSDVFHGTRGNDTITDDGGAVIVDGTFTETSQGAGSGNGGEDTFEHRAWKTDYTVERVSHTEDGETNYFVELDTSYGGGQDNLPTNIWQNVDTVVGKTYTLTFKAASVEQVHGDSDQLYVKINGVLVEVVTPEYSNGGSHWSSYTVTFTATSDSTRIEFGQDPEITNVGSQHHTGVYLDDVAIQYADDELYGYEGNDTLTAGNGDDLLVGGAGADELHGGDGFDTASYAGENGGERVALTVNADGSASAIGGDATGDSLDSIEHVIGSDHNDDTLNVTGDGNYIVTLSIVDGVEQAVVTTALGEHVITTTDFENIHFTESSNVKVIGLDDAKGINIFTAEDKAVSVEVVAGANSELSITTGNESDVVDTSQSHSSAELIVNTGDGDDTVYAGDAKETINGGTDDVDTVSYERAGAGVTVDLVGENNEGSGAAEGDSYNSVERFVGSSHGDRFIVDAAENHSIDGGAGSDTVDYRQSSAGVELTSTASGWAVGNTGTLKSVEHIIGTDQADTVNMRGAHSGSTTLETVGGADHFDLDVTNDGTLVVNAGSGENVIDFDGTNSGTLNLIGGNDVDDISFFGASSGSLTVDAGGGSDSINLEGSIAGTTTINADSGDDQIDLTGATDGHITVNGGDGSDTLHAGAATETFSGGTDGDSGDTVSYAGSNDGVSVNLQSGIGSGGTAAGDTYSDVENIVGSSHADTLTGDGQDNVIHGGSPDDVNSDLITDGSFSLLGESFSSGNWANIGGGITWTHQVPTNSEWDSDSHIELWRQGSGDDTNYFVEVDYDRSLDTVSQTVTGVQSGSYLLTFKAAARNSSQVESNEQLLVTVVIDDVAQTHSLVPESITDGWQNFSIRLDVDGDDVSHTVSVDFSEAASQNNSFGILLDDVALNSVDDTIHGGGGDDTIYGQGGHDILYGDEGADTIDGGTGNDVIEGGAGNSQTGVGDTINGGTGIDTASYEHSDAAVAVNLAEHTASGGDAAGDTLTSIENLIGSAHNDSLTGDANANVIEGLGGADAIHGGDGNDILYGGDAGSAQDLVHNGDFSNFTGASDPYACDNEHGFKAGDGHWNTGHNWVEIGQEHNGNLFAEVDTYGSVTNVSQSIVTDSEAEYILSFDVASVGKHEKLFVDVTGDGEADLTVDGRISDSDWQQQVVVFDGQGDDTVLNFYQDSHSDGTSWKGVHIDNVSVVQVDDHLYGEGGNDTLNGGSGNDILNGGDGADTFLFTAHDFQQSGEITVIEDYEHGQDSLAFSDVLDSSLLTRDGVEVTASDTGNSGVLTISDTSTNFTHTIVFEGYDDDLDALAQQVQHMIINS